MTSNVSAPGISERAREALARVSTGIFIDGQWADAASGGRFNVVNPATEEVIATVADGGPEDALRAIRTAGRVQSEWARTAPVSAERSCAAPTTFSWRGRTILPSS